MNRIRYASLLLLPLLLSPSLGLAQSSETDNGPVLVREISTDSIPKVNEKLENGWHPSLNLGANLSFGSSSNVIGQPDGDSKTVGTNLDGSLVYKRDQHEVQNTLTYTGATSTTPALPRWIKSNDELTVASIYLYSLESIPWIGPYARVQARTVAFRGEDIRSEPTNYEIQTARGNVKGTRNGLTTLQLTDAFAPLTVRESIGSFFRIKNEKSLKVKARAGVGAQQVDAAGQLTLDDNSDTENVVEVRELSTYQQYGLEFGLIVQGVIDQKTSYLFSVDTLTPINADLSPDDERSDFDLTNVDMKFKLTSKIVEWASFNYEFNLREQPQLLDETQITHLLSLSLAYTLF